MNDSIAARSSTSFPSSPPPSSCAVALWALLSSAKRGPRCGAFPAIAAGTTATATSIPMPATAVPARRNHELRLIFAPFL